MFLFSWLEDVIQRPASCISSNPTGAANLSHSHASGHSPTSCFPSASGSPEAKQQEEDHNSTTQVDSLGDPRQEMQLLKEQLEVLRYQVGLHLQYYINHNSSHFSCDESKTAVRSLLPGKDLLKGSVAIGRRTAPPSGDCVFSQICSDWIKTCNHRSNGTWTWDSLTALCQQTRIYEAEYETEQNDHKHTLLENRRLRKKREEMRQQVALLQEQVASSCTYAAT